MKHQTLAISLAILLAGTIGCGDMTHSVRIEHAGPALSVIRESSSATLYEGLPHPMFEPALCDAELASKPFRRIDSLYRFFFYESPLDLSTADRDWIRDWLLHPGNLASWSGEKKCDEFHADYCIEWHAASGDARVFFCFDCYEVLTDFKDKRVRLDIADSPGPALRNRLTAYRKNRPSSP